MNLKRKAVAPVAALALMLGLSAATVTDAQAYAGWAKCKTGSDDGDSIASNVKTCVWWEVDTSGNYVRPRQIQVTVVGGGGVTEALTNELTEYVSAGTAFYSDIDQLGTIYNGTVTIDAYWDCNSYCGEVRTWQPRSGRPVVKNKFGKYQNVRYGPVIGKTTTVTA